jgi:hypothetical protein
VESLPTVPDILDFAILLAANTFLTFIIATATTTLFIPIYVHRFGRTRHATGATVVIAWAVWLLCAFTFIGQTAHTRPWLTESATLVVVIYLITTLIQVWKATRGSRANDLDWLYDHGATAEQVRDLMQIRITSDLTAWSCVLTIAVPILTIPAAALHRVQPAIYPAAPLVTFACGLLVGCGILLNGRLRVCDTLLRQLEQACERSTPLPPLVRQTSRWTDLYAHSVDIWNRGRTANHRALEGARLSLYRLLKDRSKRLAGVDPTAFKQAAQFLVDDLARLANSGDDPRGSSAVTRVVRLAVLGDLTVLPATAIRPAALTDDKAWSRWPIARSITTVTVLAGLASSLLAITDKL